MAKLCIRNGCFFTGSELIRDKAVIIGEGIIQQIIPADDIPEDIAVYDLKGGFLAPGFIDIQVNGGCGFLFNDAPTVDTIRQLVSCHRRHGTTMLFPTLISTDSKQMLAAHKAVEFALGKGTAGLGGLHFEGPYLNVIKKGIHAEDAIRDISETEIDEILQPFSNGKLLLTVAPEKVPPSLMTKLKDKGLTLLAGHSYADFEQASQAFHSGITGVTHLYNAMSQLGSREPGLAGACLQNPDCWCTIIVDGFHVHPETLKISLSAKGADKFILITDGMPSSGSVLTEYQLAGKKIIVNNGRCTSADGTLAGSNLTMIEAVKNCISLLGLSLETALAMASLHPAAFLGLASQYGKIEAGYYADLVHLDQELNVLNTWIKGRESSCETDR